MTIAIVAENRELYASDRGVALIIALLFLSFLTILGGALITTSTIDVWINDNYKTGTQSLYLTEAGIEQARELLRTTANTPGQLLTAAAGGNGRLLTSTDPVTLLAGDDQPLIPSDPLLRSTGQALIDSAGKTIGRYHVWLRNDTADGMSALSDTNRVLTLLSVGGVRNIRKVIEVTIAKAGFPKLPSAVTLDGPVDLFEAPAANVFAIESIGTADIPGLENLVKAISANATDVYNPPHGSPYTFGDYGNLANYRVAVVNGDVNLGFGTGYGMLVARGDVTVIGNFDWYGLILVVGQGVLRWNKGSLAGGLFIARTRNNDRSEANPLGTLLTTPGGITADFRGATGGGIHYDAAAIAAANRTFPYKTIAVKER